MYSSIFLTTYCTLSMYKTPIFTIRCAVGRIVPSESYESLINDHNTGNFQSF